MQLKRVFRTWWPLAASWLLMGTELPALSAIVARMPNPKINLAAYGGVVFPVALIIESPVIMLLAASTALSKDEASYRKLSRFMLVSSVLLTLLHVLLAFTPLYRLVIVRLLQPPPEIVDAAQVGLMLMTPWTGAIAYRRFQQGVMIRFGRSDVVGTGTLVRLAADLSVLLLGYHLRAWVPGVVAATTAVSAGVLSEAIYAGVRVRPILHGPMRKAPPAEPLTWRAFAAFYVPLVFTSLLTMLWQPIGSAALSRMPQALDSLAAWPVVSGLVFMLRSAGMAYNEVVVALLDEVRSSPILRRFAALLSGTLSALHLLIAATPLSLLWFGRVSALPPELVSLARLGFWMALPMPALNVLQSWYQGAILFGRKTRGIPESVVVFLVVFLTALGVGILLKRVPGLYVGVIALTLAMGAQTVWLRLRAAPILAQVAVRDAV
ncbi:MAG: hypothetical protein Fur0018_24000 [Anaerolineales bacterium]